jgi:hypothetical protein
MTSDNLAALALLDAKQSFHRRVLPIPQTWVLVQSYSNDDLQTWSLAPFLKLGLLIIVGAGISTRKSRIARGPPEGWH